MRQTQIAWTLLFVALFLWLAYRFRKPGIGHRVIAFLASFTLTGYGCGLAVMAVFAQIPSKDFTWAIVGLYAGGFAGLIAAVFLSRAAGRHPGLYVILVLLAAALMLFLPPLI